MQNLSNPWILVIALLVPGIPAVSAEKFIDAHIHYNWDQAELISPDAVAKKLAAAKVELAIVSSTPARLALALKNAAPNRILSFFSPYTHENGKRDWFLNNETVDQVRAGLQQGLFHGIGEIHFMQGFRPRTDNPVFKQLMDLAQAYNVPALIHVDAANEQTFISICQRYPSVRIIFAHAGGSLLPAHIQQVLAQCPNTWVDFSARDPWRYGGLTGPAGNLLPDWKALVLAHPTRFITGTDPVWRVTRTQSWDMADDGWDHYEKLLAYHQRWLAALPATVRENIQYQNVRRLLGK